MGKKNEIIFELIVKYKDKVFKKDRYGDIYYQVTTVKGIAKIVDKSIYVYYDKYCDTIYINDIPLCLNSEYAIEDILYIYNFCLMETNKLTREVLFEKHKMAITEDNINELFIKHELRQLNAD